MSDDERGGSVPFCSLPYVRSDLDRNVAVLFVAITVLVLAVARNETRTTEKVASSGNATQHNTSDGVRTNWIGLDGVLVRTKWIGWSTNELLSLHSIQSH